MSSYTVRFQEVRRTASRTVACIGCGKKLKRQRTFEQTINPFNRNGDGEVKSYAEIWKELGEECDAWQPHPQTCTACFQAADPAREAS